MGTFEQSYASGTSEQPLIGRTIGEDLRRTIARHGDREALVDCPSGRRWTYAELGADVDRLARGLLAAGIEVGDRVGIWAPNCPEWVLLQYATAEVGAILVNINPAYRTHELAYVLDQSGVRLLVAATRSRPATTRRWSPRSRPTVPRWSASCSSARPTGTSWSPAATASRREALDERMAGLRFDDAINIQYTSGTTGFPKGATLSHHNILNNGYFVGELVHYTEADRVCLPVPFYHCFGMVMGNLGCTSHGACIVIPAPGFDPAATLAAVAAERCTSLYGVPTMFIAMLGDPSFAEHDLSSLRTGIMAGSPCPVEVMKRVISEMNMSEVSICYGMTETSPVSTQTRARRRHRAAGVHRRAGDAARRGEGDRPRVGPRRAARSARRAVHPRLLGDARLLARAGQDRRGRGRRRVDAHRRPRR